MVSARVRLSILLASTALIVPLTGCSGGGGGGDDTGSAGVEDGVTLEGAFYGRQVDEGSGPVVVSPLTTVQIDPVTGLVIPGTLEAFDAGINLKNLISMGVGPEFKPQVIPRNATIVLEFSTALRESSVNGDQIDADGNLVSNGSVQVRDQNGRAVPVSLRIEGKKVYLDPLVEGSVGFPASPLVFDLEGNAVADPTGYLRVVLPVTGGNVIRDSSGRKLVIRQDFTGALAGDEGETGQVGAAIIMGMNPGNSGLDFIEQDNLFPSEQSFNGFLPDFAAPRVVREYAAAGTISFGDGDEVGASSITINTQEFNTTANEGRGEWADRLLIVRGGAPNEETHRVISNGAHKVSIDGVFAELPKNGEDWRLVRAEFFEPDQSNPIDPDLFDPENPQNEFNRSLKNFVFFDEIDAFGRVSDVNGDGRTRYPLFDEDVNIVPARSVLKVRFNEPMDIASFLTYESFRVTDAPEPPSSGFEYIGEARSEEGGLIIGFWPTRTDQNATSQTEYMGFGSEPQGTRKFTIRTVPDDRYLEERLAGDDLADFIDKGFRSVTDIGGRPLAFPDSAFDPDEVFIEYDVVFTFDTLRTENYSDVGGIVHRFQGSPETGNDPQNGLPGARFHDRDDTYYGPLLADVNLLAKGVLAGAAVSFFQRTLDDQPGNRIPDGHFDRWPTGTGTPIAGYNWNPPSGNPTPGLYAANFGARFQHIFRREEASLSPIGDLAGTFMDLYRVSFAPIGGNVSNNVYEDISVHAAHSVVRPITTQSAGVPDDQFSGIGEAYDPETYNDGTICSSSVQRDPNYFGELVNTVPAGTQWVVDQQNLFTVPGTPYPYHPWPTFRRNFQYDNDHTLLLEYRVRPQDTPLLYTNGFTFSAAILSSPLPRFRVYSYGTEASPLNPDPVAGDGDVRDECAFGPQPKPAKFGDNSRYFYNFNYVKLRSRIISSFTQATKLGTDPDRKTVQWLTPIFDPPITDIPPGTEVVFEMRDADSPDQYIDRPEDGWSTDASLLGNGEWIQFRITVVGNATTLLLPTFESIVIPYYRLDE